jgi:hypothetical protein
VTIVYVGSRAYVRAYELDRTTDLADPFRRLLSAIDVDITDDDGCTC